MLAGLEVLPGVEVKRAFTADVADLCFGRSPGVVVDLLPGVAKSGLLVRVTMELATAGEAVDHLARPTGQVDPFIGRLTQNAREVRMRWLSSADYELLERTKGHEMVRVIGATTMSATVGEYALTRIEGNS
ncbi:hypothetical protein AB0B69_23790 [Micromonospora parva]|uniref:hypothetical protein n=1 Tax=Micromonospora parva TaxID=1464048 RepID=UPI0034119577